ncbi:MAG: aliphatic sulfonate ABC transporter substrate-binding protein [Treponema sp.]|nr:aliphatic sulfonate ABC transporter substrate-binding protein [Treponema sp.]
MKKVVGFLMLSLLAAPLVSAGGTKESAGGDTKLRIGFQKSSSLLILLKGAGTLEKALEPLGVTVEWNEFTSGLPMVEALNTGALDLSADVADTVPLFAQAAGAEFTYFLEEKPSPTAEGIVVAKGSSINSLSELKGKKLAVAKASGAHYLTVAALNTVSLDFNKDIEVSYLQPADARTALESGNVDAWATWDPYLATVQVQSGARIIADGAAVGVSYTRFYPIASAYAKRNPGVLKILAEELTKIGKWVKDNPDEAARVHAPLVGLNEETVKIANNRRSYAVSPVERSALVEQQKIADLFIAGGLLAKPITVSEVPVWDGK